MVFVILKLKVMQWSELKRLVNVQVMILTEERLFCPPSLTLTF